MMRSLFSSVSGLRNFQLAMDVVGNNIANVNTPGFKASRVVFENMFSQLLQSARGPSGYIGGINPKQVGLGSQVASIDKIMNQGAFQNTGKKTDLAIQGSGFFVVSDGTRYYYTRSGNFSLDVDGTLVQSSTGFKLMGWTAVLDPDTGRRVVDTNRPLEEIKIPFGLTMPAKQTTQVDMAGNLRADVGFKPFEINLKDDNGKQWDLKVWFVRDEKISSDPTKPFGDVQRYVFYVDADNDGEIDSMGYIDIDKFGNVRDAGIGQKLESGTTTSDGSGNATIDFDGTYSGTYIVNLNSGSDYRIVTLTSSDTDVTIGGLAASTSYNWTLEKPLEYGSATVAPGTVTINLSHNYTGEYLLVMQDSSNNVEVHSITLNDANSVDVTTALNGNVSFALIPASSDKYTVSSGAELVVSKSGQPKFYEADDPTNFVSPDYMSPKYTTAVTVYDTLGNSYQLYFEFVRLGYLDDTHKNVWIWRAYLPTGENISYLDSEGNAIAGAVGGVINFDETGRIADYGAITGGSVNTISWGAGNDAKYVNFSASKAGDGIVQIKLSMDEISQFAGEFSASVKDQDGYPVGVLESFNINDMGEIVGTFTNGKIDVLGKIAIASFTNPEGLKDIGRSLFVDTANSGIPQIGEAGTGGRGTLVPGALEMSNVDLAEEFTKMIIAQRGFQANARVITTADQILNEVVNLKR